MENKDTSTHQPEPKDSGKVISVIVEHRRARHSAGKYEVRVHDKENKCIAERQFGYTHRSDKRWAMEKAMSHAQKEAKRYVTKISQINF